MGEQSGCFLNNCGISIHAKDFVIHAYERAHYRASETTEANNQDCLGFSTIGHFNQR